jgi:mannosyltransferase
MKEHKFILLRKHDPILIITAAISALVFSLAISILAARPVILQKIVLPLVTHFYSFDGPLIYSHGPLTQDEIKIVDNLLAAVAPLSLLVMSLTICYSFIWRYCSMYLPVEESSTRRPYVTIISLSEIYCMLAIFVIALVLRLHGLTRGLLWDEILTAMYSVEAGSVWTTLSSSIIFNNHIGYSIFARFSESLFGRHEWALRLPALLFGLASIYWLWIFTRSFLRPNIAIIATFLLAISPAHVFWSESARGYSAMILFTLISSYFYLNLLRSPSYFLAFMFVGASVAGIYFHLYSTFVTIVQALFLVYLARKEITGKLSSWHLYRDSFRVIWTSFGAITLLSIACYAPVLPFLAHNIVKRGRLNFRPLFPVWVIEQLSAWSLAPLAVLVFLLFILGLISLWRSYPEEGRYFVMLLLFPLLIVWLWSPFDLYERFFSYYLPYYVSLVAAGLSTLWYFSEKRANKLYSHFVRLICITAAGLMIYGWVFISWHDIPQEDFRAATNVMKSNIGPGNALCAVGGAAELFQYYADRKVIIPTSQGNFEEITQIYPEIRCAYLKTEWDLLPHIEIRDFLEQKAESQQVGDVTVYTYRGKPTISESSQK